jgi:SpoVK/Ycf46/Vps4 family AAA+-type ATPase
MMNVPANFPGEAAGIEFRSWFITRRDDARAVLAALDKLISGAAKFIHGIQAPVPIPVSYDWDSLVLSEAITELVRRDFELFFTREPWFRKHGLPYRRGYLLYGPAGNGKTSVIRVMAAHPQIRAYALDLSGPDASGAEVWRLFRTAQRNAPALVILEDLDRIFPRDGLRDATRQNTFQALLNNLDGIGTYDGLIVVGTANDPTALDASILRRPGRFDRVVAFALPTGGLRQQYFQKFKIACTGEQMSEAVQESDGLSFAQLREAYILAGQHAFERDDQITGTDLLAGIQRLRNGVKLIWEPKTPLGFSGVRLHAPNPDGVYS